MVYLIDGHNLIAKMDSPDLGGQNSEADLVLLLRRWAASGRRRRLTVFFDGGLPGGKNLRLSTSTVSVVFAPFDRTADDLIVDKMENLKNPAEYTVVSNDRAVIAGAERNKVASIPADEFARQLIEFENRSSPVENVDDLELTEVEIQEWLELFSRK